MTTLASTADVPVVTRPDAISAHAWKVLAVSAAAVYVVFLDATIVNIAFPAISADFSDVTRSGLSWVLNAYAVVFGALLVTAGRLADEHGRKRVFLLGLVVFGVGSALCGLAPTAPTLIAARVVQGVGGALLVPASLALLLPEFPLAKRATAVGLWSACGAIAAATGPSLGAAHRRARLALGLLREPPVLPRRAVVRSPGAGRVEGRRARPGRRLRRRARHRRVRPALARAGAGRGLGVG